MGKQQLKLLLIAASALAMLVTSMFVLPWFEANVMGAPVQFDLRSVTVCSPLGECANVSLSQYGGGYATSGAAAFWMGILVIVLVVVQTASRLVTGAANDRLTRIGYMLAAGATIAGFAVAFIFAPDPGTHGDATLGISISIERTWAPLAFIVGNLVALMTFYQSIVEWTSDDAEYKPIKLDRADRDRLPVTPLSNSRVPVPAGHQLGRGPVTPTQQTGRVSLPDSLPLEGGRPGADTASAGAARSRRASTAPPGDEVRVRIGSGSSAPLGTDGRPRTPSQAPLGSDARARTPSHAPLDAGSTIQLDERSPSSNSDPRARTPSQAPLGSDARSRTPSQAPLGSDARARTPSQAPLGSDARARTPSQAPLGSDARSRTPSQAPLGSDARGGRPPTNPPYPRATSPAPAAIEIDSRQKPPSQPPFGGRTPSPSQGVPFGGRTPSPSQGVPFSGRTPSPSQGVPLVSRTASPVVDPVERSRTSSSGPIDISARLNAASPVAIRPPLPTAEPVPPDQIPVDPAAGLTIRKRTPSAAPLPDSAFAPPIAIPIAAESGLVIRKKSATAAPPTGRAPTAAMPAVATDGIEGLDELKKELSRPIAIPQVDPELPAPLRGKLKFAVISVELASIGVRARHEDGTDRLVDWDKIVGVIARRLPPDAPYDGATFVDIVSTAGSTLRVLQWTRIVGGLPLSDAPVERARELVNVIAAQALGAKLDPATKRFAEGNGQAAQIPTTATLATHDSKV